MILNTRDTSPAVLIIMHIAAYVPCVTLMPRLTAVPSSEVHP